MTLSIDPDGQPVILDPTGEISPYPFFEYMRRTDPVWHGALMDTDQMPEELRPERRVGAVRLRRGVPRLSATTGSSPRPNTTRPSAW